MRLRNNKSVSENGRTNPKGSLLDDQIQTSSDEVGVSRISRNSNHQGNRSRKPKASNKVGVSRTSINIVGITKRNSGKYGVKVYDRIRKKDAWLGTYGSAEEATRVYWAKKKELENEFQALPVKLSETKRTSEYVGVSRRASGKFAAHIRDPIRKKKLYLGAFDSEKEASKVYLAKKKELEKEVKGTEGVRWSKRGCRGATSLDFRKRRSVGKLGQCNDKESSMEIDNLDSCNGESDSNDSGVSKENLSDLEENNDDPCLVDNQESSKEFDNSHSLNGATVQSNTGVSKENLLIQEQNDEDPCSDNQESPKEEIHHSDSSHKEVASVDVEVEESSKEEINDLGSSGEDAASVDARVEDIPIQKNNASTDPRVEDLQIQKNGEEKELIVVDSSVESLVNPGRCSDAKVLLRTKSGTPLMNCNGYLLGEWSCIDDLSLSINM